MSGYTADGRPLPKPTEKCFVRDGVEVKASVTRDPSSGSVIGSTVIPLTPINTEWRNMSAETLAKLSVRTELERQARRWVDEQKTLKPVTRVTYE